MKNGVRPRGLRPSDLAAEPDEPACDRHALDNEPHCYGGGVPTARDQSLERRSLRKLRIEVKWLRIELSREGLDLLRIDSVRAAREALANLKVVEIEQCLPAALLGTIHASPQFAQASLQKSAFRLLFHELQGSLVGPSGVGCASQSA